MMGGDACVALQPFRSLIRVDDRRGRLRRPATLPLIDTCGAWRGRLRRPG
jgi:hypothetical protein